MVDRRRRDDKAADMYALYQIGKSLSQVAQAFGVTRQSVYSMFEARGWEMRPLPTRKLPKDFNGLKYTLKPNGYYRRTDGKRTLMHRDVWEFYNGPIPDGWDVHHKDEDKSNNNINNLECMPKADHTRFHNTKGRTVCRICGKRNRADGYCMKHWYRLKQYGDPFMTSKGRKAN